MQTLRGLAYPIACQTLAEGRPAIETSAKRSVIAPLPGPAATLRRRQQACDWPVRRPALQALRDKKPPPQEDPKKPPLAVAWHSGSGGC